MNLINWNASLSVKIGSIDAQHQKLVSIINALNEAMLQGKGKAVLGAILADLAKYTAEHFHHEETLMTQAAYPKFAEHKAEHKRLVEQVEQLARDFESGSTGISVSVMNFLSDWLRNHIMGRDMDYIASMQAKGIR